MYLRGQQEQVCVYTPYRRGDMLCQISSIFQIEIPKEHVTRLRLYRPVEPNFYMQNSVIIVRIDVYCVLFLAPQYASDLDSLPKLDNENTEIET